MGEGLRRTERGLFERARLMRTLGVEVRELEPERVVATIAVTPDHLQPFGFLHGGASLALAESVASLGGTLHCLASMERDHTRKGPPLRAPRAALKWVAPGPNRRRGPS